MSHLAHANRLFILRANRLGLLAVVAMSRTEQSHGGGAVIVSGPMNESAGIDVKAFGAVVAICLGALTTLQAQGATPAAPEQLSASLGRRSLTDAQSLFYNAHYEAAAALTLELRSTDTETLASAELRTSALLFQLKALLEKPGDLDEVLKRCTTCPALIADFLGELHTGQKLARTVLASHPGDESALFFLGKLDLNYVWLQLGPLRRRTGWDEYWEARRSLDAVLKTNPNNVRARVARAWIDYIVDTKMPWGTKWLLGGGNRKRALTTMCDAAGVEADFYTHAEAEFGLWNMQVREGDLSRATEVARRLVRSFPDNPELTAFLDGHQATSMPDH